MDGFVHLHVHSHYSLLDGAIRMKDLAAAAKSYGMPAVAISDHGNLFGAVDFYKEVSAAEVKPIMGMEAYISPTTRFDKSMGRMENASYHMLLLAMNDIGWKNLMKLSSRGYLEGFYYRPRIDRELLAQCNEGLICTTACLGGEVPAAILSNQPKLARKVAGEYLDIFGRDRFFLEVQNQGIEDQRRVNIGLLELAGEMDLSIVGTNDAHFLHRKHKKAHEVLCAISTGKVLSQSNMGDAYTPEMYFKNMQEMREALKDLPGAADNTLRIAEMCNVKLDFKKKYLPVFTTPSGESADSYLSKLAWEGLAGRFPEGAAENYKKRLEWEIKVIADKGYSSYFLIVNDFVQYARRNNIPAAPRGSGVATLLGYCLGIADVDPIRYGLLFERFTDPQRKEDPDIDIDICQEGRGKVIQYVREKYGHVAQIITYGTLKAKAAVKDVCRVLEIPLAEADAISKKVPDDLKMTLEKALKEEPELKNLYDSDPRVHQMMDHAITLEGLARHAGVHAAGVVVCDQALENLLPLYKQSDKDDIITQWDGPTTEKAGMMKMDFLGLRTLTIVQRARELVKETAGVDLDPEKLPLDDDKVYELFRHGWTDGVFQFESDGMKNVLIQMQPTRIEDLIAANAMYRPGPIELIPLYCARKNGREQTPSLHPLVDELLAETYGIMTYQEQVMQVVNRLGKLSLSRALTLIKAIGKKKLDYIAQERPQFIAGAQENGISEAKAGELFELIEKFAGYGFNKAHSTRYAILAYQTAYFKTYYPREFFAATLTYECSDTDKVVQYMSEASRMNVKILPPDINACGPAFAVDDQAVRFGLAAVKGVGERAVEAIVESRKKVGKFRDLYHFCENVDSRSANRSTIEALIKCGAFDAQGAHRAAMTAALDHAIELGQRTAEDRRSGQMSIFGAMEAAATEKPPPRFPDVEPWSEAQLLTAEKETLGFYITTHPLVRFGRELDSLSTPCGTHMASLEKLGDGARVNIGCMIAGVRTTVTKNGKSAGKKMAMITLEDLTGKADAVLFSETYERLAPLLKSDSMVFVAGSVDRRRERPNIVVDEIVPMDSAIEQFTGSFVLRLGGISPTSDLLKRLHEVLVRHRGACPIFLELRPASRPDVNATIRPDKQWFVKPSRKLVDELVGLLREENLLLRPKPMAPKQNGNGRSFNRPGQRPAGQAGPASAAVTRFN